MAGLDRGASHPGWGGLKPGAQRRGPRLFLPFALVGASAVLVSTVVFFSLFSATTGAILADQSTTALQAARLSFQRAHETLFPAILTLSRHQAVQDYLGPEPGSKESILAALNALDAFAGAQDLVHSVYLVSELRGTLSTRAGWEPMTQESDPSLAAFLSRAAGERTGRYHPRRVAFRDERAQNPAETPVLTLIFAGGRSLSRALVVNLWADRVRRLWTGTGSSGPAQIVLLGADGVLLSHPEPDLFGKPGRSDPRLGGPLTVPRGGGTASLRIEGVLWRAVWLDPTELGWTFVSLTPESVLFQPLADLRNLVVGITGLVLLVLGMGTFLVSQALARRWRGQEVLASYLAGTLDPLEAAGLAAFLPGGRGPWALAWIQPARGGSLREADQLRSLDSRLVVAEHHSALVVLDDRTADGRRWQGLAQSLSDSLHTPCSVIYEPLPVEFSELPAAVRRLAEGARTLFRRGYGECRPWIAEETVREVSADERSLGAWESALRSETEGSVGPILDELMQPLGAPGVSETSFRVLIALLVQRTLRVFQDDAAALLRGGVELFRQQAAHLETIEQARDFFLQVGEASVRRGALRAGRHQKELCQRVKQCMVDRLSDRTLGTALLADEVGLSPHYLRDLFRQVEGESLVACLGRLRIDRARDLLGRTDRPIREICDEAGFLNYSYFFTFFKKMTGMTPSEYRQSVTAGKSALESGDFEAQPPFSKEDDSEKP